MRHRNPLLSHISLQEMINSLEIKVENLERKDIQGISQYNPKRLFYLKVIEELEEWQYWDNLIDMKMLEELQRSGDLEQNQGIPWKDIRKGKTIK